LGERFFAAEKCCFLMSNEGATTMSFTRFVAAFGVIFAVAAAAQAGPIGTISADYNATNT
jgi:hypothetical protein